jgi:hypothetical protein
MEDDFGGKRLETMPRSPAIAAVESIGKRETPARVSVGGTKFSALNPRGWIYCQIYCHHGRQKGEKPPKSPKDAH